MALELSSAISSQWKVISVVGQVDSKSSNDLRDYLQAEVNGAHAVALELSQVPFMSSAGLRTLLTLYRQTQSLGVPLALVGLQAPIVDTMKITGFYQHFTVYASLEELP
ncbi:MAG: STAS domain-containing protein [Synechococcus sp.]|nr:STAS domain-containing protein [Synechococcus sp.]